MSKSSNSKGAARKAHDTRRTIAPKVAGEKGRDTYRKSTPKIASEKARGSHHTTVLKVGTDQIRDTHGFIADQFEEFRYTQVPDSMRGLAEMNIAQTRELYERSKDALQAVLASWQKSFGAAGQGAVAFNFKIMDIAERNINTGFDLAMSLAGAKNLAEAMELYAAHWRKQLGDLQTQAEEVRLLSTRVTANVTQPIQAQVTRGVAESSRRKFFG